VSAGIDLALGLFVPGCGITTPAGSNSSMRWQPMAWEQAGRQGLQQEMAPCFEWAQAIAGELAHDGAARGQMIPVQEKAP
jgi:hypothetical protein